ncbi:hypothetical protein [Sediminibacterium soli]|uniref:hypothetical protein n=1 Tax=Sediminibacterium soli TaxID=2698829 RepID=UPI00137B6560|nr:hypothetical protein [Sediminibacterium soli]NCI45032.1 hypothetical protein [Sediminibacterium soli]
MTPENFTSHLAFEKLQQLQQILTSDAAKEKIPVPDAAFFDIAYNYIIDRLKLTIPILLPEAEMTSLANEIDAGMVQINSYLGNNNTGHVSNAINNFNSVITRVRNFPLPLSTGDFDFSKSIASFQQATQTGYESIKAANEKLILDLAEAQANLDAKQNQLTAVEQKLTAKEVEIQNVLGRYNTEFDSLKTTASTDIDLEKKKFNEVIDADRKLYKEQFDADKAANIKSFEEQKAQFEKQSSDTINSLNSKLAEANKIVNIVGNVGVTGNYQNIADENKKSADNFRSIALAFMIIMSGLLIWSIIEISKNGEFNLYKSLVRILAAAVLTYPAVYAARESTKHRKLETQNRNLELELASIGPFIELLPEDKKQKIKEELVNKYFGNQSVVADVKGEEDVSVNALERIFKAVLPFIKK